MDLIRIQDLLCAKVSNLTRKKMGVRKERGRKNEKRKKEKIRNSVQNKNKERVGKQPTRRKKI